MSEELRHYGTPRHSGRYPWGSGKDPYQNAIGWRGHIQELKDKGLSDVEIARAEGMTTTQLRARQALTKAEIRANNTTQVLRMKERGYSNMEIGRRMGLNESTVRSLLDPVLAERASITMVTANMLKDSVDMKRFVDVGAGIENHIGVSRTKLNTAIAELQEQGYKVHRVNVPQVGMPGQFTIVKVLGAPDTQWREIVDEFDKIQPLTATSDDHGRTFSNLGLGPIQMVDSNRIQVRYAEEGGGDKDGVIELRRGAQNLDMGGSKYAQVRIGVDGSHFLKGMAIYNDDMPDGVDIIFNTNKHPTGNKLDAMKKLKRDPADPEKLDPDNPFGASIKRERDGQRLAQRGAINIVNEEGDWESWSKTLSSQMLSKQTVPLAKTQLDLALKQKQEEYSEIMTLTNPVVQKQLLLAFADDCDASAVHLKAAGLPRQASKVILPVPNMKATEVYAPTFKNGETVVLIRHPHGGTFEIPQLTVNNKSKAAQAVMKNAPDAIGINPSVAQKLSGADFDGDTVIVIPNNAGLVRSSASLKALENFDPIEMYRIPEDSNIKPITPKHMQNQMGVVSNLITDMTIKGANTDEVARAVRHSMVIIDSEKHGLDYRRSYVDHGIASLAEKYQSGKRGGASTIISKASSEIRVPHRRSNPRLDTDSSSPTFGMKLYTQTGETYLDKKGRVIERTTPSTRMAEETDAFNLSSGRQIEEVYAEYANNLKTLATTSRRNAILTIPTPYSPSARQAYENEVASLNAKLNVSLKNKPIERQAQILANSVVNRKKQANPGMEADEIKKVSNQALAEMRVRTGAKKFQVAITDKEWEAIQAGAVSPSKLTQILQNTDLDRIKQLATPRTTISMTPSRVERAKSLLSVGHTQAEVAEILGVSTSTLSSALREEKE